MEIISKADAIAAGLKHYFNGRPCKHGHISERYVNNSGCVTCARLKAGKPENREKTRLRAMSEEYKALKREKRKQPEIRAKEYAARDRWKNTEAGRESRKRSWQMARQKADPIKTAAYCAKYRQKLKSDTERLQHNRERRRVRAARYLSSSKSARIRQAMSNRLRHAIRAPGAESKRSIRNVGYTVAELMEHLEKQFLPGMTWENYGRHGWHIDHIIPCSNFDLENDEDFAACWSLANLRPLWGADNIAKKDKVLFLL